MSSFENFDYASFELKVFDLVAHPAVEEVELLAAAIGYKGHLRTVRGHDGDVSDRDHTSQFGRNTLWTGRLCYR